MRLRYLLLLFALTIFVGCHNSWGIRGNGNVENEKRDIEDFTTLQVGGAYTVYVKVGGSPSIEISAEENLLPYIRTRVKGDLLVIDSKKSIRPRKAVKLIITTNNLEGLEVSGANSVFIVGIDTDNFWLESSGACSVELDGITDDLSIEISGACSLDAEELTAITVNIDMSGACNALLNVTEKLDASVSGVGSIEYIGSPKVRSDVSGLGSISKRGK